LNTFLFTTKNKLIILDNASRHKNKQIQNAITKNNSLLYSVPYQHGTQAIEGFFNILKSRLKQKSSDLSYNNLCLNIKNVISEIPKFFYLNLIKGTYKK
jgi:transposase